MWVCFENRRSQSFICLTSYLFHSNVPWMFWLSELYVRATELRGEAAARLTLQTTGDASLRTLNSTYESDCTWTVSASQLTVPPNTEEPCFSVVWTLWNMDKRILSLMADYMLSVLPSWYETLALCRPLLLWELCCQARVYYLFYLNTNPVMTDWLFPCDAYEAPAGIFWDRRST